MKEFFYKLFHIYPGEGKKALLFAFLGFLWALGVTSGLKFADALFLLHVGADSLPIAYIWTACIMVVLATFLIKAFHRFPAYRIFLFVLSLGFVFYGLAYFWMQNESALNSTWLWFVLRVFGTLFFTVVVTCFWTFIDQYHHFQDAKRLYSLFSSMIFLGVAATGAIMRSGKVDFQHLTLIIMVILLVAFAWIIGIVKTLNPIHDSTEAEDRVHNAQGFQAQLKAILMSRFTLLLMLGNFLTYLLLVITEYNYLSSFDLHFDPQGINVAGGEEEAGLTLFIGQCLAVVSISNLIFGLFIYSRLVRRFGASSVLAVTPIILLITFCGWPLTDSLIFPIMGYFVVEGTLYVIDDSNFNLLLNAVPSKLKYKIRIMIESFFEPIGMLISAFLLTVLQLDSKLLGLILASCSLAVAVLLRRHYVKAIYQNLSENAIHFQRNVQDWFSLLNKREEKYVKARLLAILKQKNTTAQIFAAEGILDFEDIPMLKELLYQSEHWDGATKCRLLELLARSLFATHHLVLDTLEKWLQHQNEGSINAHLYFYLAKHGLLHPDKAAKKIHDANLMLKGASIISLQSSWGQLAPKNAALNTTLAANELQLLLESSDEDEVCMGIQTLDDVEMLLPFLKNPSLKIARAAASCLAQIADKPCAQHANVVIEQLESNTDNEFRLSCLKALCNIAEGSKTRDIIMASAHFRPNERRVAESVVLELGQTCTKTLLNMTKDATIPDRCRVIAGRVLGRLEPGLLKKHLKEIIEHEIERANFYYRHYHGIEDEGLNSDLAILKDALLTGFRSVLDFIIHMLGVSGEIEDCELLSRSMHSNNLKIRSQVVETLEKSCDHHIFRCLQPLLLDQATFRNINSAEVLSLPVLLDKLSQSYARLDRLIAALLKQRLNIPNWKEALRFEQGSKTHYHQLVHELLET